MIFDTFALYGFGIGIIQLYVYAQPFLRRFKRNDGYVSELTVAMMVVFLLFSIVDNVTPSVGFVVFFIYPEVHCLVQNNKKFLVRSRTFGLAC